MQKDEGSDFNGFAYTQARLRKALLKYCLSKFDPEIQPEESELIVSSVALKTRLGFDWEEFPGALEDGSLLRDVILAAADATKGMLSEGDAQMLEFYREEFDHVSILIKDTKDFLASGSPTLKLQRGYVQYLQSAILHVIEAAFIIGATTEVSDSAKYLLKTKQAEQARKARAEKPFETALRAAIIAERGNGRAARPAKEAAAILSAVNARLKSEGFKSVKLDVIYRRLKSFARS